MLGAPASDVIPRKLCGREFGVHIGVANVSCCCCCSRASFASVEIIIARRHGGGVWWWQTHAHTECNKHTHDDNATGRNPLCKCAAGAWRAASHTHTHTPLMWSFAVYDSYLLNMHIHFVAACHMAGGHSKENRQRNANTSNPRRRRWRR